MTQEQAAAAAGWKLVGDGRRRMRAPQTRRPRLPRVSPFTALISQPRTMQQTSSPTRPEPLAEPRALQRTALLIVDMQKVGEVTATQQPSVPQPPTVRRSVPRVCRRHAGGRRRRRISREPSQPCTYLFVSGCTRPTQHRTSLAPQPGLHAGWGGAGAGRRRAGTAGQPPGGGGGGGGRLRGRHRRLAPARPRQLLHQPPGPPGARRGHCARARRPRGARHALHPALRGRQRRRRLRRCAGPAPAAPAAVHALPPRQARTDARTRRAIRTSCHQTFPPLLTANCCSRLPDGLDPSPFALQLRKGREPQLEYLSAFGDLTRTACTGARACSAAAAGAAVCRAAGGGLLPALAAGLRAAAAGPGARGEGEGIARCVPSPHAARRSIARACCRAGGLAARARGAEAAGVRRGHRCLGAAGWQAAADARVASAAAGAAAALPSWPNSLAGRLPPACDQPAPCALPAITPQSTACGPQCWMRSQRALPPPCSRMRVRGACSAGSPARVRANCRRWLLLHPVVRRATHAVPAAARLRSGWSGPGRLPAGAARGAECGRRAAQRRAAAGGREGGAAASQRGAGSGAAEHQGGGGGSVAASAGRRRGVNPQLPVDVSMHCLQ